MLINQLKNQFYGFLSALIRYPLVLCLLLVIFTLNIFAIQNGDSFFYDSLYTLLIGASLSAVAQQIYEHFFDELKERVFLYIGVMLLTIGYYFAIHLPASALFEVEMKTGVLFFTLIMMFISVPSIKSDMTFDKSFMATVKAFFTTLLFTVILAIGMSLVIFSVDYLLISMTGKVYSHVFNLIFTLFGPLFFLSLIPKYRGTKAASTAEEEMKITRATAVPKLFEVLLSYILIPLAVVYTLVLVIYVLSSIRSEFWSDNLLEPMLVSYSITIILLTLLVSQLTNLFSRLFTKVIPKVLIPLVFLQLIASILKVGELGLTHGRYYVILYGVFALIASIVFSFWSIKQSGWLAIILIVFSVTSVVPPIDAFTVSRTSQVTLLKQTLMDNGMLDGKEIVPNGDIEEEDKQKIIRVTRYLDRMNYTEAIDWLPNDIIYDEDFKRIFGFGEFDREGDHTIEPFRSSYLDWEESVMNLERYDRMVSVTVDQDYQSSLSTDINGVDYELLRQYDADTLYLTLTERHGQELIQMNMNDVFDNVLMKGTNIGTEDATITVENEYVRIDIIVNYVQLYDGIYSGNVYLFIEIKK